MGGGGNPQSQTGGPTFGGQPPQGGFGNPQAQSGTPLFGIPPAQFGGWGTPQAVTQNEPGQRPFSDQPVDFMRALRMQGIGPNDQGIDTTDFMSRYPQFRNANGGFASFQ